MRVGLGIAGLVLAYVLGLLLCALIRQRVQARSTEASSSGLASWRGFRRGAYGGLVAQLLAGGVGAVAWFQGPALTQHEAIAAAGLLSIWAGAPLSLGVVATIIPMLPEEVLGGSIANTVFLAVVLPLVGILNWALCGAVVGALVQRASRAKNR